MEEFNRLLEMYTPESQVVYNAVREATDNIVLLSLTDYLSKERFDELLFPYFSADVIGLEYNESKLEDVVMAMSDTDDKDSIKRAFTALISSTTFNVPRVFNRIQTYKDTFNPPVEIIDSGDWLDVVRVDYTSSALNRELSAGNTGMRLGDSPLSCCFRAKRNFSLQWAEFSRSVQKVTDKTKIGFLSDKAKNGGMVYEGHNSRYLSNLLYASTIPSMSTEDIIKLQDLLNSNYDLAGGIISVEKLHANRRVITSEEIMELVISVGEMNDAEVMMSLWFTASLMLLLKDEVHYLPLEGESRQVTGSLRRPTYTVTYNDLLQYRRRLFRKQPTVAGRVYNLWKKSWSVSGHWRTYNKGEENEYKVFIAPYEVVREKQVLGLDLPKTYLPKSATISSNASVRD
jgi:hypothetical protein